MANMNNQSKTTTPGSNNSCLKAAGISCVVILVTTIIIGFWLYSAFKTNPVFKDVYKDANLMTECLQQIDQVEEAFYRYNQKNGKYPSELNELYPTFLENKNIIICPLVRKSNGDTSYEYKAPDKNATGSTVVMICNRHRVLNAPVTYHLLNDGSIWQYTSTPDGKSQPMGVEVKSKRIK
ncbi:MAG: hypothetical protein ACYC27_10415 [Armatimonadota bacterium]